MDKNEQLEFINQMLAEADLKRPPLPIVPPEPLQPDDEVIELGKDFNFDGFQVVRREFFAHISEPSVVFNNC